MNMDACIHFQSVLVQRRGKCDPFQPGTCRKQNHLLDRSFGICCCPPISGLAYGLPQLPRGTVVAYIPGIPLSLGIVCLLHIRKGKEKEEGVCINSTSQHSCSPVMECLSPLHCSTRTSLQRHVLICQALAGFPLRHYIRVRTLMLVVSVTLGRDLTRYSNPATLFHFQTVTYENRRWLTSAEEFTFQHINEGKTAAFSSSSFFRVRK